MSDNRAAGQVRYRLLTVLLVILAILLFARSRAAKPSPVAEAVTPTNTHTPSPTPTATITVSPTPVPSPTATAPPPPSATPQPSTPTPTATASPTATPSATATATVFRMQLTATPDPYTIAPVITGPRAGAQVLQNRRIVLRWFWNGLLAENEYFDVKIRPEAQPKSAYTAWESADVHAFSATLPPGRYFWTVQVLRGQYRHPAGLPEDRVFESFAGPESAPRLIEILPDPQQ